MNNRVKVIFIAGLIIAIIVGADKLLKFQNKNDMSNEYISGEVSSVDVIKVNSKNFEEEVIKCDKKVLIDFYATWCGPCKVLSPTVSEIANEREDIKVVKIDIDEEVELADKYNIMSIPTLIVIENGEVINRSVGVISKQEIENML